MLKRIWRYIWHDDSWGSFVLNIALAFVIIRFIVYPVLGAALGTGFPIVAVVSGSMEHDGTFDEWWQSMCCQDALCIVKRPQASFYESRGMDASAFAKYPFRNGFNKGDIMVLFSPKNVNVGDVIVFRGDNRAEPIIHRVIATDEYQTKGDHNCGVADFEKAIPQNRVVGKAVLRVPVLGYIKIVFVELLNLFWVAT